MESNIYIWGSTELFDKGLNQEEALLRILFFKSLFSHTLLELPHLCLLKPENLRELQMFEGSVRLLSYWTE